MPDLRIRQRLASIVRSKTVAGQGGMEGVKEGPRCSGPITISADNDMRQVYVQVCCISRQPLHLPRPTGLSDTRPCICLHPRQVELRVSALLLAWPLTWPMHHECPMRSGCSHPLRHTMRSVPRSVSPRVPGWTKDNQRPRCCGISWRGFIIHETIGYFRTAANVRRMPKLIGGHRLGAGRESLSGDG